MAVRAPASFVEYLDYEALKPRRQVLVTQPNNVLEDQQLLLTKEELVVSDHFRPYNVPITAVTWFRVGTYWTTHPDLCGYAATKAGVFAVRYLAGGVNWDIGIYNTATAARYTVVSTNTAGQYAWSALTACALAVDGSENEIRLEVQCPTGLGASIDVCGIMVFV